MTTNQFEGPRQWQEPPGVKHQTVMANGLQFHVVVAGPERGPLILLLHGFPEFWFAWRNQIGPLAAAGWRVAAPDQRGYGGSDKPPLIKDYVIGLLAEDAICIARALGHDKFVLAGHDWGGIVAWEVAAREPASVLRLAIINAPRLATVRAHALRHPTQLLKSAYVAFFQFPLIPEVSLRAGGYQGLKLALSNSSTPGTFLKADLAAYVDAWSKERALTSMLNWYRALPASPAPSTGRISAPTLVIWGDKDSALDRGLAEQAIGLCERGRVEHVSDASHWVHLEKPAVVNHLLLDFVQPPESG